jgi:TadE-like protein
MSEGGQAAVELVALLPLLALLLAACWQVVLVGQTAWSASAAARGAARAAAVGSDPEVAARRSLPGGLERHLHVRRDDDGVAVRLRIPSLVPAVSLGSLTAHGRFEAQA